MPRKKREDGQPVERSLKMPAWLSAEVETISELSGMTQAKITALLAALVFPETLAGELRQRVYAQLGELLLPGHAHLAVLREPVDQADAEHYTPHQLEQAALFGVDPADVVIPAEPPLNVVVAPPPDLGYGLPVGEGIDPDEPPF